MTGEVVTLVALGFLDRLLRQSWRSHGMSSGWNGKRASMNCAFLRKKGKRKRTPERLCVNQCNKTAYGHDQIIWSKSIQKEWSGFSPVLASSSPHAASRGSRAALGLRHQWETICWGGWSICFQNLFVSVRVLEEDVVCLLGNFCVACEWFQMLGQNQIISPFRKFKKHARVPKKKGDVKWGPVLLP